MGKSGITIAIDGPASSGKGTVARLVARRLGYTLLDTGALYRAVGLRVLREGGDPTSADDAGSVAEVITFRFRRVGDRMNVEADGEDVTDAIRAEAVGRAASAVAVHPRVRAALLGVQRAFGAEGGVVMDGRDVGTVVLPNAELKIYLDASLDERAKRRHLDLPGSRYEDVRQDLAARDTQDSGRTVAPLRAAEDAVHIDTTGRAIDDVVGEILALAVTRGAGRPTAG